MKATLILTTYLEPLIFFLFVFLKSDNNKDKTASPYIIKAVMLSIRTM